MRQSHTLAALLFTTLFAVACPTQTAAQSEPIKWRQDLATARAEAQQTGKLVLVHFWTESCGPCRLLERNVFSQPQVAMALESKFVPVKVNAHQSMDLAKNYGVTQVPTDVITNAQGELVKAFVSPASPMEYVGFVNNVAAVYRSQEKSGPYATARAAAPYDNAMPPSQQQTTQNVAVANPAYSGLAAQNTAGQSVAPQQVAATPPSATNNPYAAAPVAQPVAASQPAAPVAAPQTPVAQESVAQTPVTPIAAPTGSSPAPEAVAQQAAAPQLPPGSPPLGFDGFCPVTMKSEWRWAKGDTQWGAIHRGRTYLFASESARDAFLRSPDSYSPVLSGADPVVAVEERRTVQGVRDHAVEYEGRFYLFSSEETLNKFWTDAKGYSQGVQRVASALPADGTIRR